MISVARPAATPLSGAGRPAESASMQFYRRLFSDTPERSVRVRIVALIASVWAAGTLIILGASLIVPLIAIPFFVAGHIVAYRAISKRIPAMPIVIALVIIVVGVAMRHELVLAVRGERIPVAHFLLISGAASVFEARTRAGLYTQLFFSALIMFFASELAFGNEFAGLLGGYLAIIVTFLALSQYTDLTRNAAVARRGGAAAATLFWAGVAAMVGVAALAAFLLLPWDASQTPEGARFAILPVSGAGDGQEPPITPEQARQLLEEAALRQGGAGRTGGSGESGGGSGENEIFGGSTFVTGETLAGQGGSSSLRPTGTPLSAPELDEGTVAYIRSSVASYWRGGVYDSFDSPVAGGDGEWLSTLPDNRRIGSLFRRPDGESEEDRYLQTFFMQQGLGSGFITGYEPLSIAITRDGRGRPVAGVGDTYQVVSGRPAITPEELRLDQGGWAGSEFGVLPPGYGDIYALARALTVDAETDFDRAAGIAAYLNGLEYDPESTSPLESSGDLTEFVFGERPGSAVDFATAQALMSRAAGLQSRVATGFLPGRYNPYSGASEIMASDLHAWAEVLFSEAGWVPFDASSRPDLPTPSSLAEPPPSGLKSLLDRRLGDDLASALSSSPDGLKSLFEWLMKTGPLIGVSIMLLTAIAGFAYWWRRARGRRRANDEMELLRYSAMPGPDRAERLKVLRSFGRLERRIAKAGFRRRRDNEPIGVYAERAARHMAQGGDEILLAALAAERAAYASGRVTAESAADYERATKSAQLRSAVSA